MKKEHKVTVDDKILCAADGALLADVLTENGFNIDFPCGRKGRCKKCLVSVDGKEELSCRYCVRSDISVKLHSHGDTLSVSGAEESFEFSGEGFFAVDIGTTTIAAALVNKNGKIVQVITRDNSQRKYGADVISRIEYCRNGGLKDLHSEVVSSIDRIISDFSENYDLSSVKEIYVSGNMTMLHLFLNVDCSAMGVFPYTPIFLGEKSANARELGIHLDAEAQTLPGVDSFVGADIVAGLNIVDFPENPRYSLLIDFGTNAEIALFTSGKIVCTSAAAGPCFEGVNISCGMSATDGAIDSFDIGEDGIHFTTIGGKSARGICGTGLIDIVEELYTKGVIDETGLMEEDAFEICENVRVTQQDIRAFQLAKSAVMSAVLTLLKRTGVSFDEIFRLYISGGFSARLNFQNAAKIGLLPEELIEKCTFLYNSSLLGTVRFAHEKNDLTELVKQASFVDLSSDPDFSKLFIENMYFRA